MARVILRTPYAQVPQWILEHPTLPDKAKVVWGILAKIAHSADPVPPSNEELGRRAGRCTPATARRAKRDLAALGALVEEPRIVNGRQQPNDFELIADPVEASAAVARAVVGGLAVAWRGVSEMSPPPRENGRGGVSEKRARVEEEVIENQYPHTPAADSGGQAAGRRAKRGPSGEITAEQVQHVFDTWVAAAGKNGRTRLDDRRRRKIVAALAAYPIEDVLAAVVGWRRSPFHMGRNAGRKVHNELTLVLRDAEHIERFRDLELGAPGQRAPREVDPDLYS